MNKQEVIEEIKKLKGLTILDKTINFDSKMIPREKVLNIINQLDESEKPVVPKFVADMIVKRKRAGQSVVKTIENLRFYEDACKWVRNNGETFVKAWLYCYEVNKEKLYKVSLKRDGLGIGIQQQDGSFKEKFTKTELNEFGFNDLDMYEIKEVEE